MSGVDFHWGSRLPCIRRRPFLGVAQFKAKIMKNDDSGTAADQSESEL
jgi:hypothetical protein